MKAIRSFIVLALAFAAGFAHAGVVTVPPFAIGGPISGLWYNPQQSGHGFTITTAQNNTFVAVWFVFTPNASAQSWVYMQGTYDPASTTVTVPATIESGTGFPPNFDHSKVAVTSWGTVTFTFTDCNTGTVSWTSTLAGYGSGTMPLKRLTAIPGLACID
ncbi:MAG TPA: hypothetical protein VF132_04410 [Rudaea sp.]